MPQNRETGAEANKYGRETAKKIARLLGAERLANNSNEVRYDGKHCVIKCARGKNFYIGVTTKMLKRIENIIAAFEDGDGSYELYELSPDVFDENMRIGFHENIGLVRKKVFEDQGHFLKTIKIER